MTHNIIKISNQKEWLRKRTKGIGGSDAACILGLNPYKTNLDLWRETTGSKQADDISNNDAVKYGKQAEEYLRQLFMLDYPQYNLVYAPYDIHQYKDYSFIQGTFDGELLDTKKELEKGLLEIKTSEIKQSSDWLKWKNQVPQNYFCQVLHYFAIDEEYKYCKLKAQLKHYEDDEVITTTKHYHFLRDDYKSDIELLIQEEIKFWWYVENDKEPPLKLPQI